MSAPPTTTGVPAARPVSAAAARGHRADHRARDSHRREDRAGRARQIEHARPTRCARPGRTCPSSSRARDRSTNSPREPREDPVAEHADVRGRARARRAGASASQQEARRRGDRDPVAGAAVDPLGVARLRPAASPRSAARESTFGQAQSSRPARVVEHHALAHAGRARPPAMSAPPTPAAAQRLAHALADQRPVGRGVEDLRARARRARSAVRPLALADRRAARRRASNSTARQLPVPASIASSVARRSPRRNRSVRRRRANRVDLVGDHLRRRARSSRAVAPPMCGVITTLAQVEQRVASPSADGRTTSSAAPPRWPERERRVRARPRRPASRAPC